MFRGRNARLHAKGEGEDNRWRGGGARHRGMACDSRVGVVVGVIYQRGLATITELCSTPAKTSGTLFSPGELRKNKKPAGT